MHCRHCGKEMEEGRSYCFNCHQFQDVDLKPRKKAAGHSGKKPIYKRWWFWVIAVVLVFAVIGGGGDDHEESQALNQTAENPVATDLPDEPATSVSTPEVTVNESILYNSDGVRITVKSIEESLTGINVNLLVENSTTQNIAVSCSDFVVNGITMYGYMYIDVAAGKKANDAIFFAQDDLDIAGIDQIATIKTFDAYISDTDTYMKTKDISFAVHTSVVGAHVQSIDDSGSVLYSQNGISVIAKDLADSFWGGTVIVLVKNNSNQDIIAQADNLSVNGYTVSVLHSDAVCSGTARFCEIDLFQSDLDKNEIENIEDVTFSLAFIDPQTYQTIFETGELRVSVDN